MGEVIHVAFGTEREWEETREKLVASLTTIGALFEDDEDLMTAKAEVALLVLRAIVEDIPTIQVTTKVPQNLCPEDVELLTASIKEATLKGIEVAMTHSVQVLMANIYDLCTSKLRKEG